MIRRSEAPALESSHRRRAARTTARHGSCSWQRSQCARVDRICKRDAALYASLTCWLYWHLPPDTLQCLCAHVNNINVVAVEHNGLRPTMSHLQPNAI